LLKGPVRMLLISVEGVPDIFPKPKGFPVNTNLVSDATWPPTVYPPKLSFTSGCVNAPPPTWLNLSANMLG
jgi:hypothetical protein